MELKICCTCKNEKPLDNFNFRNKELGEYHCSCVECWKEIRKKSYENNKQAAFDRNNRNRKITQRWYHEYKSNLKCISCGETHTACLDFHHRDPTTKKHTISALVSGTYSLEIIKNEIDKCDVMCSNCHRKHHYDEITNKRYIKSLTQIDKQNDIEKIEKIKYYCVDCNSIVNYSVKRCYSCNQIKNRKVIHPDKETLLKLVWETPIIILSKEFGVSDTAIKKWCKNYGINTPPRGYWAKLKVGLVDECEIIKNGSMV